MKRRSPILVLVLSIITFGIYALVWYVITKGEMNRRGARIPTALLIIIPLVNIYWMWKFCEGVGHVTKERMSGPIAFLLLFFLSVIGMAIVQSSLNNVPRKARPKRSEQ
ncbi:MAG: DUF4234 domain-containing protein [Dehalococcoidia bacterium]